VGAKERVELCDLEKSVKFRVESYLSLYEIFEKDVDENMFIKMRTKN